MRAVLLIIDSLGVGALPDAHLYGDEGSNTALHVCKGVGQAEWPNLKSLGLGNCSQILGHILPGCTPASEPLASYGVMNQSSHGKDTTTGHWELAGIELQEPFTTFPSSYPSFPGELLQNFTQQTGYQVLGNKGASGTAIIEELGEAHINGKGLIFYTSADSVVQIAAHEKIVRIEELYKLCEIMRDLCDPYKVGRVIARPFTGEPENFIRTANRKDFSMLPPQPTILDILQQNDVETIGIGKIGDIFCEQGIDISYHDAGNSACLDRLITCLKTTGEKHQFFFVNLVDTDMLFGHRRDIQGYHDEVQRIDTRITEITRLLSNNDLLLISADHGCDPGFKGSDHTREYVPILSYCRERKVTNLGIRNSFCDVAQSLAAFFNVPALLRGESYI